MLLPPPGSLRPCCAAVHSRLHRTEGTKSLLTVRQFVSTLLLALASPVLSQEPALQVDWVKSPIDGHWYGVEFHPGNWTAAVSRASAFGLSLAEPASADLDNWIDSQFTQYLTTSGGSSTQLWVGLFQDLQSPNYSEPAGGWSWVSGQPATFIDWAPGQPDDDPDEHVAVLVETAQGEGVIGDLPADVTQYGYTVRSIVTASSVPQRSLSWPSPGLWSDPEDAGLWITASDLNADGKDELIVGNHGQLNSPGNTIQIYTSISGTWQKVGEFDCGSSRPHEVSTVDFNEDGILDLAATCYQDQELVLLEGLGGMQ